MTLQRRRRNTNVEYVKAQTGQYVVMFLGSSSVDGYGATLPWANFVNQLAPKLVDHALGANVVTKRQVYAWRKGDLNKPPNDFASPNNGLGWSFAKSAVVGYSPGMFFFNGGIGGRDSGNYFQANEAQTAFNTLLPDLVIHMVGSNDYYNNRTPDQYVASLQATIDYCRAQTGGRTRHVFIHTFERLDVDPSTKTYRWAEYGKALRQVCNGNLDAQFVDCASMWAALGIQYGAAYPNQYISSDGVHCNDAGYKKMAELAATGMVLTNFRTRLITALSPDDLPLANGAAVSTAATPTSQNPLEPSTSLAQGTAANQPVLNTNALNGRATVKFNGSTHSLDQNFSRSYGLPVSVVFAVKAFGVGMGAGNLSALFARTSSDHMGYLFGIQRTRSNTALADLSFLSNFGSRMADNLLAVRTDQPIVIGVVFRADGDADVYLGVTNPITQSVNYSASDTATIGDQTQGPFINSLRLGANTGRASFSSFELADFYLYDGEFTKAEMNSRMQSMATKYGLTLGTDYAEPTAPSPYLDELGTQEYSNTFQSGTDGRNLTADGWTDLAYSTTVYQVGSAGSSQSGVQRLYVPTNTTWRPFDQYQYATASASLWHWVRAQIFKAPVGSPNAKSGVGLVLHGDGTNGIIFRVSSDSTWSVYFGAGNSTGTAEANVLGSGSLPAAPAVGDELVAAFADGGLFLWLNKTPLNSGNPIDLSANNSVTMGQRTGVHIGAAAAGELTNFRSGVVSNPPVNPTIIETVNSGITPAQLSTNSPTVTMNLPPSRQLGDLMVLSGITYAGHLLPPSGWVTAAANTSTGAPRGNAIYKLVTSADMAVSTVSIPTSKTNTTEGIAMTIVLVRGVHQVRPMDAAAAASTATNTTAHSVVAVTTTSLNRRYEGMVLRFVGTSANSATYTWPAPYASNKIVDYRDTTSGDSTPNTISAAWTRPTTTAAAQAAITATSSASAYYGSASCSIVPPPYTRSLVRDDFTGTTLNPAWAGFSGYPPWVLNGDGTAIPGAADYSAMYRPLPASTTSVLAEMAFTALSQSAAGVADGSGPGLNTASGAGAYGSGITTNITARSWWVYRNGTTVGNGNFATPLSPTTQNPVIVRLYISQGQYKFTVNGDALFQAATTDTAYSLAVTQDRLNTAVRADYVEARVYV